MVPSHAKRYSEAAYKQLINIFCAYHRCSVVYLQGCKDSFESIATINTQHGRMAFLKTLERASKRKAKNVFTNGDEALRRVSAVEVRLFLIARLIRMVFHRRLRRQ